jgi:serine/threonine protein kinase
MQRDEPRQPHYNNKAVVSDEEASKSGGDDGRDDEEGHFTGGAGTLVGDHYEIVRDLGIGTFGRVVECKDRRRGAAMGISGAASTAMVAIKVVRDVKRYYESAQIEADILTDVNSRGGRGRSLCVQMLDRFDIHQHYYCLVFESLGKSLYDFLKSHDFAPFPLYCVRDFAFQLLDALDFMHQGGMRLIHTDLKPENILLVSNDESTYRGLDGMTQVVPASTKIKIIDFGGATYDDDKKSSVINTRQYRAPEVILEVGWSLPSDLWSLGCIISELYTGDLLFATHDNKEHLALIEQSVGPFPRDMFECSSLGRQVFDVASGRHRRSSFSPSSLMHVRRMLPLENILKPQDKPSGLLQLLRRLLTIDAHRRATAAEARDLWFCRNANV